MVVEFLMDILEIVLLKIEHSLKQRMEECIEVEI